jgi:ribonuclease Z
MLVLDWPDFRIISSPNEHYNVPNIALRMEIKRSGLVVTYSCDTRPCESVVRLAHNADILIHEATGADPYGHSSAAQAGEVASEAGAKRLVLIHYEVWGNADPTRLIAEAQTTFDGPVELAEDFLEFDLSEAPLPTSKRIGRLLFRQTQEPG